MSPAGGFRRLFRLATGRSTAHRDAEEELELHVELRAQELMDAGLPPEEARSEALRLFGDLPAIQQAVQTIDSRQEQSMRRSERVDELRQDLHFAVRTLRKNPGFSAAAVLTLAFGIGAATALLSIVNGVLFRTLPYPNADRALLVWSTGAPNTAGAGRSFPFSAANFVDLRTENHTLETVAAFRTWPVSLIENAEPELVSGARVAAGFFEALGVKPVLGRTFTREDDRPEAERVVALGYGLWRRRFGGDPRILGRQLTLGTDRYTVIGVMPSGFQFPRGAELPSGLGFGTRTELWVPIAIAPADLQYRGTQNLAVLALPKPGFTKEAVAADLAAVMQQLEQQYPQSNRNLSARVTGLAADAVARVRPALLMLLGAVGFLLLIACVNVSNLLLTRTAARYREMAVRSALGAGRRRLVRQLLTENMLLAGFGGLLGVLLAGLGKGVLLALVPANLPRADDIAIDWRVLGVVALVVLGAGVGFGLVAGGQVAGGGVQGLREGTKGSTGTSRRRLRHILVVGEVALSVILLSGAALLAQSFFNLRGQDTGFETRNVLTARVALPIPANLDFSAFSRLGAGWARTTRSMLERVERLPGVIGAGSVSTLPLSGLWESAGFAIEGEPPPEPGREPNALYAGVSDGYFAALGIPLLWGRTFNSGDRDSSSVVVISAALAKRYWPGHDPIGRRIRTFGPQPLEVIGIVGDVRQLEMGTEPAPAMYFPLSLYPSPMGALVVRTSGDPRSFLAAIRRELKAVDPGAALTDVNTMEEVLGASLAQQRFSAFLLSVFGASALGLALLGLYGVVSFGVARRSREIGIRLALGARPAAVLGTVLWEGIGLSALGIGIGVIGTLFLSRTIRGLVFGIGPSDPLTLTLVSATLVVVAVAASIGPARRAMRVDPVVALRTE